MACKPNLELQSKSVKCINIIAYDLRIIQRTYSGISQKRNFECDHKKKTTWTLEVIGFYGFFYR